MKRWQWTSDSRQSSLVSDRLPLKLLWLAWPKPIRSIISIQENCSQDAVYVYCQLLPNYLDIHKPCYQSQNAALLTVWSIREPKYKLFFKPPLSFVQYQKFARFWLVDTSLFKSCVCPDIHKHLRSTNVDLLIAIILHLGHGGTRTHTIMCRQMGWKYRTHSCSLGGRNHLYVCI